MFTVIEDSKIHKKLSAVANDADDGDFFDVPVAKLRGHPRPLLSYSSSSEEPELTSEHSEDDDPDSLSSDLYSRLQIQLSSLNIQTNFNPHQRRSSPIIPSKYLFDETGRRWSRKPVVPVHQESFPSPKHQDGRSKCLQKSPSIICTALSCWQIFIQDSFLENHIMPWLNNKEMGRNARGNEAQNRKRGKERMANGLADQKEEIIDTNEMKAFIAVLYARVACDISSLESAWSIDAFTPSFFMGAMKKDTFFKMLNEISGINERELPTASIRDSFTPPAFLNEFTYRLIQSFDPGDTLVISDRIRRFKTRATPRPTAPVEGIQSRQAVVSWLRDARCGFFLKVAATVHQSPSNNMIVEVSEDNLTKRMDMDQTMRCLVGHAPISGSGRTVYTGHMHAGVDCASEMYENHKLRFVGQLPSSGFFDRRAPFLPKARSVLKRTSDSSVFLFDYPLALISYQCKPPGRAPDVLISTAHFSTNTVDCAENDKYFTKENFGRTPPAAWIDYQRFMEQAVEPIVDFCGLFFTEEQLSAMPLERILFFDCLYVAAYNAYILWTLQPLYEKQVRKMGHTHGFKAFLRTLASELVKGHVTDRLSREGAEKEENGWRASAKMILQQCEEIAIANSVDGAAKKIHASDVKLSTSDDPAEKKPQKKQTKKRGKCRK